MFINSFKIILNEFIFLFGNISYYFSLIFYFKRLYNSFKTIRGLIILTSLNTFMSNRNFRVQPRHTYSIIMNQDKSNTGHS